MAAVLVEILRGANPGSGRLVALADVEAWPTWAHIAAARTTPPGPVSAHTSGTFRFRPVGRSRFTMTEFDPPRSWTWSGRAMARSSTTSTGSNPPTPTRRGWCGRCAAAAGLASEHTSSAVYARLIDRLATIQGLSPAIPERELNTPAGPAGVVSAARSFPLPAFDDVALCHRARIGRRIPDCQRGPLAAQRPTRRAVGLAHSNGGAVGRDALCRYRRLARGAVIRRPARPVITGRRSSVAGGVAAHAGRTACR